METLLIEIRQPKALALMRDLEALDIIRVITSSESNKPVPKPSERFRGSITPEEADAFNQYLQQSRHEWERPI